MSTTDIAVRQSRIQAAALPAKIQYAHELATSGLLPAAYRRNPGNVLYAIEYGEMLGLPPMAAMTGVHVIEGKPTASAGLISGLVRQAGHKLHVRGNNKSATCVIIRSDDPEHPFEVTWTLRQEPGDNPSAEVAGLLGKNTWKNYPAAMLKSRAITQCARDACEEVLYGLHYTPEELGAEVDEDGVVVAEVVNEPARPAGRSAGTPADDQFYVRPADEAQDPWLTAALEKAPELTLEACTAMWRRSAELVHEGKITKADAAKLQVILQKRVNALNVAQPEGEAQPADAEAAAPAAVVLDPDDPWAAAIEGLASLEDADTLLQDVIDQRGRGEMDPERAAVIERAIEHAIATRFPTVAGEQVAA